MIYQENVADNRGKGPLYNAPTALGKGPVTRSAVTNLPTEAARLPPPRLSGSRFSTYYFMYLLSRSASKTFWRSVARGPWGSESGVRKRNPADSEALV